MSSSTFSAAIRMHSRLRQLVLISGSMLALTGSGLILLLPFAGLSLSGKVVVAAAWTIWSGRELLTHWRVYGRWSVLILQEHGEIELFGKQESCTAKILPGSIVLPGIAWLRIRAENGQIWGELVVADPRESEEWRRFQVIFRHLNTC